MMTYNADTMDALVSVMAEARTLERAITGNSVTPELLDQNRRRAKDAARRLRISLDKLEAGL